MLVGRNRCGRRSEIAALYRNKNGWESPIMNKRVIFLVTAMCIAGAPGALIAQNTNIPRFDIDRSCRTDSAEAAQATGCRQDEMQARGRLEQQWSQILPRQSDTLRCAGGRDRATELRPAAHMPANDARRRKVARFEMTSGDAGHPFSNLGDRRATNSSLHQRFLKT